jgi:hypothetical protein
MHPQEDQPAVRDVPAVPAPTAVHVINRLLLQITMPVSQPDAAGGKLTRKGIFT